MFGRPSRYLPAFADAVLEHVANGGTVKEKCRELEVAPSTFFGWVVANVDGLADRYAHAQRLHILALRDETMEIADNGTNDWIERQNRDGLAYEVVNHEHVKRSEIRIKQRNYIIESIRTHLAEKDADGRSAMTPAAEAIAALERIASTKAEPAQVKPRVLPGFEDGE